MLLIQSTTKQNIMTKKQWSKQELKIYILLLCANADSVESQEELDLIQSKTNTETFTKIYNEFKNDNEDEGLEKIADSMQAFDFSHIELANMKKEIHEVFFSDGKFLMMEKNLDSILDNIVY